MMKIHTYLWGKNIEITRPIGTTDELAFVLGGDARIFRNPDHRRAQSVSVQVNAIERFTLLFTETLN